jgi:dTDP-4-dehydrorhamnose reductase
MKMLIFGNGWIGNRIAKHFGGCITGIDILDYESARNLIAAVHPEIVVNAAGKCGRPNVDWCERSENRKEVLRVNGYGPRSLEMACQGFDCRLVHLSSGCLWERGRDMTEVDNPVPPSWYAETKRAGELRLRNESTLVLRLRMPVSGAPHPRNLITKLATYESVIDEPNSVTFIDSLLFAMHRLIEQGATGIFHVVNPGALSAAQIMAEYRRIVDPCHPFKRVTMQELAESGAITARRSNVTLSTAKLNSCGVALPDAKEMLQRALESYNSDAGCQS